MKKFKRLAASIAASLSFGSGLNVSVNANVPKNILEIAEFNDEHKIDDKYYECSLTDFCRYLGIGGTSLVDKLKVLKKMMGVKDIGISLISPRLRELRRGDYEGNYKQIPPRICLTYNAGSSNGYIYAEGMDGKWRMYRDTEDQWPEIRAEKAGHYDNSKGYIRRYGCNVCYVYLTRKEFAEIKNALTIDHERIKKCYEWQDASEVSEMEDFLKNFFTPYPKLKLKFERKESPTDASVNVVKLEKISTLPSGANSKKEKNQDEKSADTRREALPPNALSLSEKSPDSTNDTRNLSQDEQIDDQIQVNAAEKTDKSSKNYFWLLPLGIAAMATAGASAALGKDKQSGEENDIIDQDKNDDDFAYD